MLRERIPLPEKFQFTTELAVRVADLNYGGHVGNDSVLSLMQEARVLYYRSLGYENEVSIEGSVGQIITSASIEYKSESFLGDMLVFRIAVGDFTKYGFTMYYHVSNRDTHKDVAIGKTGIVCIDYASRKLTSIPESLTKKLKG